MQAEVCKTACLHKLGQAKQESFTHEDIVVLFELPETLMQSSDVQVRLCAC